MAVINLSVLERLKLLSVLPQQGDFTTLRIVRRMREALSFSEDEHEIAGIKVAGDSVSWASSFDRPIEFGLKAREMVRAELRKLNDEKKLSGDLLTLVEKFAPELCPAEEDEDIVEARPPVVHLPPGKRFALEGEPGTPEAVGTGNGEK